MPRIIALWGPFVTTPRQDASERFNGVLTWYFFGVRATGQMARWSLVFESNTRSFRANALEMAKVETTPNWSGIIDSNHVWEGKMVDILRRRLAPADIAETTALLIARKR